MSRVLNLIDNLHVATKSELSLVDLRSTILHHFSAYIPFQLREVRSDPCSLGAQWHPSIVSRLLVLLDGN